MKKILLLLSLIVVMLSLLTINNSDKNPIVSDTTEFEKYETLPSIDIFPSENIGDYTDKFNTVSKATLFKNGEEKVLENDDPRLIQLLNLCAYSQQKKLSAWSQGEVDDLDCAFNYDLRLELEFSNVESTSTGKLKFYDRAVVAGKKVWLIQTNPLHPTIYSDWSVMHFIPFSKVFLVQKIDEDILEYVRF